MMKQVVRHWSSVLLLAVAWLLLQQGAWLHALKHDVHALAHHDGPLHQAQSTPHGHHHHHAPADSAHDVCDLCVGLQAAHAALPGAILQELTAPSLLTAVQAWVALSHQPAPTWRGWSRGPPPPGNTADFSA